MVYGSNGRRQKRSKSTVIILFVVSSLSACILLAIRFELSRKTLYPLHSIGWQKGARGKPSKAKVIKPAPVGAGVGVNEGSMLDSIQPGLGGAFGTWKPTTTWAPHTINSRPITQIQLVSCILPPSVFNLCSPKTNPKEILLHGEWTRIERDLNMRAGSQYLFLFVRESHTLHPCVKEVKIKSGTDSRLFTLSRPSVTLFIRSRRHQHNPLITFTDD